MPIKGVVVSGLFMVWVLLAGCSIDNGSHERMVNLDQVKDNPEAQLQNLNEAIAQSKRDGSLYARRAIVLLRKGELTKALEDADKAVHLTKNEPFSLFVKAQVLRALNRPNEALPLALQAERNSYQSSSLYVLLGELYLQKKQYQQASAYLKKAQELSPSDEFVFYFKGRVAEVTSDTLRAVNNYKLAVDQAPEFMEPQRELAGVYIARKEYAAAQPYLKAIEKSAAKDGLVWFYKGLIYQSEQKQDSAIWSFSKAVALSDSLLEAHYKLGLARYTRGETELALQHLVKAYPKYRNTPGYLLTLAGAYERTGQADKALETYQQLVKVEPQNSYGYKAISRLKYKLTKPLPDTTTVVQDKIELLD
ncbi:tetratricopeptide repeat protein [Pontibacter sp. MBLB2868]|uniref:tetratricopeptide repeat protein n=1 Tax=Pontibacter sp. MBLB2868 TaxID=3451555 RepID=UPI003F7526F5